MNYRDILQNIGWPTICLVLDFETYFDSEYTLSKMSIPEYVADDRFEFTGLGVGELRLVDDSDIISFYGPDEIGFYLRTYQGGLGENLERCTVVVKNAKFDILILKEKFGINPPHIIDIEDLSRHYDARMKHRLKDLAKMFGLKAKGDTMQFKGLHYEELDKSTKTDLSEYCKGDVEIESELFKILLPKVSNPHIEIPLARHTLQLYLEPKIMLDSKQAETLKNKMEHEPESMLEKVGYTRKEISGNKSFVKLLEDALPNSDAVPMKVGKRGLIPALAKDDEGTRYLLTHPEQRVRELMQARQNIKSWPLHIKRVQKMINIAEASGGVLPIPLKYYGGHTGRWSGTGGINPQNFGGKGRGKPLHPLISQVKGLLYAPNGHEFLIADYCQIEARILAWLAGQDDLVAAFARGEDIYSEFATKLFGQLVYKPDETDPEPVAKIMSIRRGFGKDAILGAGYGMGANRFYNNCIENDNLRLLFESGKYDQKFIEELIKKYRVTYSRIPGFWTMCEKAFKWVIKRPDETVIYPANPPMSVGNADNLHDTIKDYKLLFKSHDNTVFIVLPSGRELRYPNCRVIKTTMGEEIRWKWGHLWGGSIVENVVQAVARDIMAGAILKLEKLGVRVVHHIHDEIICLVKKNKKDIEKRIVYKMCNNIKWTDGLPIDAEAVISTRLSK